MPPGITPPSTRIVTITSSAMPPSVQRIQHEQAPIGQRRFDNAP
jgi:hypothetical protein